MGFGDRAAAFHSRGLGDERGVSLKKKKKKKSQVPQTQTIGDRAASHQVARARALAPSSSIALHILFRKKLRFEPAAASFF
jgi:hypothetical protein